MGVEIAQRELQLIWLLIPMFNPLNGFGTTIEYMFEMTRNPTRQAEV